MLRTISLAGAALLALAGVAAAADTPGVTATEIKIGQTMPYTGPASAYAVYGKLAQAYFKMINDQGGISGHKLVLVSLDDSYDGAKAAELTKKLVEEEKVAFIYNTLGTPSNAAIRQYLNDHKVPQLFPATGADMFADPQHFPWTMGWQPSYRVEAKAFGMYILKSNPGAKVGVIYQNDGFGKDYIAGLKDAFGDKYATMVVKEEPYAVSEASIDEHIAALQAAGADTLVTAATPKFAVQTLRKVAALGWKPTHLMSNVSTSIQVIEPVGLDKVKGLISGVYSKDLNEAAFKEDPGLKTWREFMKKYMPDADAENAFYLTGYGELLTLTQVLKQCGSDFSRENIMKQAANLKMEIPVLLPGIVISTSPTDYRPVKQMQLMKFNGQTWERFGDLINGAQS